MADIDTSQTFAPGDTVTDAKLNNIIDGATIQAQFISAKSALTSGVDVANDFLVIYDASAAGLKKISPSHIPGVASVDAGITIPGTSVTVTNSTGPDVSIDINQLPQSGNKVLAAPAGGASGLPTYRKLVPKDVIIPYVPIAAFEIDWSLGNYFYKAITVAAGNNFSFIGGVDGQTIFVEVSQGGAAFNIAWPPGINWENGTPPNPSLSPGVGRIDMFQFWFLGGRTLGKRILTNAF